MNPAFKMLLFLLALPFLIVIFTVIILPLVILLLILSLFIPSVRVFHLFQTPQGPVRRDSADGSATADDTVCDVKYTVVDTAENDSPDQNASGSPPELKS